MMQLEFHIIYPHQAHQESIFHIPKQYVIKRCYFIPSHFDFLYDPKPKPLFKKIVTFDLRTSCNFLEQHAHSKKHLLLVSYFLILQHDAT